MKLQNVKDIPDSEWRYFKFGVGKQSMVDFVIISSDLILQAGTEFVKILAASRDLSVSTESMKLYDIRDSISAEGAIAAGMILLNTTYRIYDLRGLEVIAETNEYTIAIYNGTGTAFVFQVDIVYQKPYK